MITQRWSSIEPHTIVAEYLSGLAFGIKMRLMFQGLMIALQRPTVFMNFEQL